jgi:hypothetical protein
MLIINHQNSLTKWLVVHFPYNHVWDCFSLTKIGEIDEADH